MSNSVSSICPSNTVRCSGVASVRFLESIVVSFSIRLLNFCSSLRYTAVSILDSSPSVFKCLSNCSGPARAAINRGVSSSCFFALTSAPLNIRSLIMSLRWIRAAMCKGVSQLHASFALTQAPLDRSKATSSIYPPSTAWCSGVLFCQSLILTSAPFEMSDSTLLKSPFLAALSNGFNSVLRRLSITSSTLAPLTTRNSAISLSCNWIASLSGVLPSLSLMLISAPLVISNSITSLRLFKTPPCKGVPPNWPCAFMSAPWLKSSLTISSYPALAA